jgi:hypothetical protein
MLEALSLSPNTTREKRGFTMPRDIPLPSSQLALTSWPTFLGALLESSPFPKQVKLPFNPSTSDTSPHP